MRLAKRADGVDDRAPGNTLPVRRKRAREGEARFREVFENAGVGMIEIDADWNILSSNMTYCRITGRSEADLRGANCLSFTHPEDIDAGTQALRSLSAGEINQISFEKRYCRPDGEVIWVRSNLSRVSSGKGGNRFLKVVEDITGMREAREALRESEARFRAMADSAPAPVWVTGPEGIEFANRAFEEVAGRPADQLTGEHWMSMIHPDELGMVLKLRSEAWVAQSEYGYEARFRNAAGDYRWMRVACRPRFNAARKLIGYVGLAIDVDDSKRAEFRLRESEERLRVALAAGQLGDWDWDAATDIVTFSDQAAALFGIAPGPVMTWNAMQKLIQPDDAARAAAAVEAAVAAHDDYNVEYRLMQPEGGFRWINAVGRPVYGADDQPTGMIGVVQDISARKTAERTLREESGRLATLNRVATSIAPELDLQKVVQMVTDAGVELTGAQFGAFFYNVVNPAGESYMLYTISGVDPAEFSKFPMPRNTEVFAPTFGGEAVVRSDDIKQDPRYGKNAPHNGMPQGHLPVTSYLAVPVRSRSGEVIGGLFFGHEERGKFTGQHEQLLVGIAGQAAIAIDNARLYEAAQREIAERRLAEQALHELNQSLELRVAAAIEQREKAEEALRQSQKMEAVGQLTGGIAHDFNNLLTIITGNIDAARRHIGEGGEVRVQRALGNALVGAERAAILTQRLLAFSRRQPLAPRPIEPNKLVAGMSDLLRSTLGETVEVETVLGAGLWRVEADPHQLENSILNLAVNARDAMGVGEDGGGGKLTIETSNTHFDRDYAAQNPGVSPGQYVAISISDTGSGMDQATLEHAFEPFFTTKEVGRGTGLGLSMVYGFIKQSGGHLKIYSELGEGTTVRIYLPRLVGAAMDERSDEVSGAPEGSRDETILVCEDDDDVRAYTVDALRELGYRVLEAHDGPSALRLLERQEGSVDLLFTDVVLPGGMTGAVLAAQARTMKPDLKVLFTTGYARNAIVHHGRLDPGVELITKPFSYATLAARIRDMLDR
jgi:PAS domain S-box-containing protein